MFSGPRALVHPSGVSGKEQLNTNDIFLRLNILLPFDETDVYHAGDAASDAAPACIETLPWRRISATGRRDHSPQLPTLSDRSNVSVTH